MAGRDPASPEPATPATTIRVDADRYSLPVGPEAPAERHEATIRQAHALSQALHTSAQMYTSIENLYYSYTGREDPLSQTLSVVLDYLMRGVGCLLALSTAQEQMRQLEDNAFIALEAKVRELWTKSQDLSTEVTARLERAEAQHQQLQTNVATMQQQLAALASSVPTAMEAEAAASEARHRACMAEIATLRQQPQSAVPAGGSSQSSRAGALVEAGKVLLRGVPAGVKEQLRAGDSSGLGLERAGRWTRCWPSQGGALWNVVLEVSTEQAQALRKAAPALRQSQGIIVAPYLTAEGRAQRRLMTSAFSTLRQMGLNPRWRGACGIVCGGMRGGATAGVS